MPEQAENTAVIRLFGSNQLLGARFEPPLPDEQLFDSMIKDCPVVKIIRTEEGEISDIFYQHIIYGVGDNRAKVNSEFINRYRAVANHLGRTIASRNMNAKLKID